jgi:Ni/Co efflux regulator RcnB
MKNTIKFSVNVSAMLLAGAFLSAPALAEKPSWVEKGNGGREYSQQQNHQRHQMHRDGVDVRVGLYFGDQQRAVIRDYYQQSYQRGHCPPGLSKKNLGCLPPGQAKKWRKGYQLPRHVIFHDLPPRLVVELGLPPAGYRYVRVAADILLITIGAGLVIDAIEDLGNM